MEQNHPQRHRPTLTWVLSQINTTYIFQEVPSPEINSKFSGWYHLDISDRHKYKSSWGKCTVNSGHTGFPTNNVPLNIVHDMLYTWK